MAERSISSHNQWRFLVPMLKVEGLNPGALFCFVLWALLEVLFGQEYYFEFLVA